ncbi:hypothetical protein BHU16_04120 [Tannerella sp. oral taxon 808]|nr:hypothetical protein BHU16_04120 [Tannerella sp. oral taxon 808]
MEDIEMRTNRLSIELLSETNPFVYLIMRDTPPNLPLEKAANINKEAYCKFVETVESPITKHR